MAEQGPLSGQKLGDKYLLGDLIGQGGFGSVYLAQHLLLGRQQAIKILLEHYFANPKFRERFAREARTLAAFEHPTIVPIHDFGIEGNRAYLVMPYLSGGSLHDLLKQRGGPLSLEEITRYLDQICAALGYAHARSVAHLDLKPLNLLLHADGHLLLSDFGLAHLVKEGAAEGGSSLQFGSPYYMAPEHFDGQPTQRSDLYALGILLYQMLVGRVPFDGPISAVMRKHLLEPPPPLRAARPDLPPALENVIQKALAKKPEQRYGRAGELLIDFKAAVGVTTSNPYASQRTAQFYPAPTIPYASQGTAQFFPDPTMRVQNPPSPATIQEQHPSVVSPAPAQNFPMLPGQQPPVALPQFPQQISNSSAESSALSPMLRPAEAAKIKSNVNIDVVFSIFLGMVAQAISLGFIIAALDPNTNISCCDASGNYYVDGGKIFGFLVASFLAFLPGLLAIFAARRARQRIRSSNGRLISLYVAESGLGLAWLVPGVWIVMLLWWPVRWLRKE